MTLDPTPTTLHAGTANVLRSGHVAQDGYGNKLEATPGGILTTT